MLPDGSYSELSVSRILRTRGADGKETPAMPVAPSPEAVKGGAS
jgi:NADH-quinone oxidoreductase subunit J